MGSYLLIGWVLKGPRTQNPKIWEALGIPIWEEVFKIFPDFYTSFLFRDFNKPLGPPY